MLFRSRRVKGLTEIVGIDPETNELITNSVFTWNPADDTFNYSGHSYIYEKIRTARNWTPREMEREVRRRVEILEYMRKGGATNYKEVAKIISAYYKYPEKLMEEIRAKVAADPAKFGMLPPAPAPAAAPPAPTTSNTTTAAK